MAVQHIIELNKMNVKPIPAVRYQAAEKTRDSKIKRFIQCLSLTLSSQPKPNVRFRSYLCRTSMDSLLLHRLQEIERSKKLRLIFDRRMDKCIDSLRESMIFSTLDANSSIDKLKSAKRTEKGSFYVAQQPIPFHAYAIWIRKPQGRFNEPWMSYTPGLNGSFSLFISRIS